MEVVFVVGVDHDNLDMLVRPCTFRGVVGGSSCVHGAGFGKSGQSMSEDRVLIVACDFSGIFGTSSTTEGAVDFITVSSDVFSGGGCGKGL